MNGEEDEENSVESAFEESKAFIPVKKLEEEPSPSPKARINEDLKEVEPKSSIKEPKKVKDSKHTTPLTGNEDAYSEDSQGDHMSPKMNSSDFSAVIDQ